MASEKDGKVAWLPDVREENYPHAEKYLGLIYTPDEVARMLEQFRAAPVTTFQGKDIFRASGLSLLGLSNSRVERDREKIRRGTPLSPLLLVRDAAHGKVVIADGYHRLCALYGFDEGADIPCKII